MSIFLMKDLRGHMPASIKHGKMKQHIFKITFLDGPSSQT
jgi:hypothetical protein